MARLHGKTVFITGTAGGQGRAAAQIFANEGAYVIGCDIKEQEAAETVDLIRKAGGRMESSIVDLADLAAAEAWIEQGIKSSGKIDVLYNNAGNPRMSPITEMSLEDWSHTIHHELDIIFNTVRPAWQYLVANGGGVIINTASVSGHRGYGAIGQSAHAAAKAGIIGLTRQLAAEGASSRIRVNSISPGGVITPALGVLTQEQLDAVAAAHPLGRAGQPEDIAYCALYLASDEASWVTGADFVVDGGINSIIVS